LLHVSEMGWSRVTEPSAFLKPGEEIQVKVLRVDEDGHRISLGVKQLGPDPWSTVESTYAVGDIFEGRVVRLTEFGAFVEVAPGIEGLAHVSTFPPGGQGSWARLVPVGSTSAFEIVSIDSSKRRMALALVPEGSARQAPVELVRDAEAFPDAPSAGRFGASLADKLRGAFERK